MSLGIKRYTDKNVLYSEFAAYLLEKIKFFIKEKGFVSLVLCGGKTPAIIYPRLVALLKSDLVDLTKIYIFFGDERFLPLTEVNSNYFLARENFLSNIDIPSGNIFPMISEYEKGIAFNKNAYAAKIEKFFQDHQPESCFDLVWLGLGMDGHTASLFPDDKNLLSSAKVKDVYSKQANPPIERLSLGIDIINKSNKIVFFADSLQKEKIMDVIINTDDNPAYPASFIDKGKTDFFYLYKK